MSKRSYKFTDKTHPVEGILSVIIGIFVIITLVVLCYRSSVLAGQGPFAFGIIGILAFLLTIGGLSLGVLGLREKDIFFRFPMAGIIMNGILLLVLFFIYIVGTIV